MLSVQSAIEHTEVTSRIALAPATITDIVERIQETVETPRGPTVLLCSAGVRFAVRQLVEAGLSQLAVLSHAEVPPTTKVVSLGVVQ